MKTIIVEETYPSGHISFRVYHKFLWFTSKPEYVNGIFNRFPSLSDAVEAVKREIVQSKRVAKKTEKKIVAEVVSESHVKYYEEAI